MASDRDETRARLDELAARCAAAGRPMTIQRRAVLECLIGRADHPTADVIHVDVKRRFPGLSRTTVYRSLETLVELGLVGRVDHPGAAVRYDPVTDRHHHRVCDACGTIEDVWDDGLSELSVPELPGFQVSSYSVQLRGVCDACRRGEA